MAASKEWFYCNVCGYETYKWMGRCPSCNEWSSFEEKEKERRKKTSSSSGFEMITVNSLKDCKVEATARISTGISELDRVLGGGAVCGSVLLLGGDPGIGKSTLILQAAGNMHGKKTVLYASGEESLAQIKLRAARLKVDESFFVTVDADVESILKAVEKTNPDVLIIDSVQAVYNSDIDGIPGSINQIKETAAKLIYHAKKLDMTVFFIGHVTKEGAISGPRLLEHMVDGVFYLEGERYHSFRVLRGVKNRFGSTNEIGVFMMNEEGLEEVADPSLLFISSRKEDASGSTITASMNGSRPFLVEIQSLVNSSGYATPRRTSTGIDHNRVALIMAVLEKHLGLNFYGLDTFVNAVGGVRLIEPAVDLAVAVSLLSSIREKAVTRKCVILGEVGLTGEIRPVTRVLQRVMESEKMGFDKCFLPGDNLKELKKGKKTSIELIAVENINSAVDKIFG